MVVVLSKNAGRSVRLAVGFVLRSNVGSCERLPSNEGAPFEHGRDTVRSCRRFAALNALRRVIRYIAFAISVVFPSLKRSLGATMR